MSTTSHSAVAEQSKTVSTKVFLAGLAAVASLALGMAVAPATSALGPDNLDLGTGVSTQDGDEWSNLGLRIAGEDGLENLGIGALI